MPRFLPAPASVRSSRHRGGSQVASGAGPVAGRPLMMNDPGNCRCLQATLSNARMQFFLSCHSWGRNTGSHCKRSVYMPGVSGIQSEENGDGEVAGGFRLRQDAGRSIAGRTCRYSAWRLSPAGRRSSSTPRRPDIFQERCQPRYSRRQGTGRNPRYPGRHPSALPREPSCKSRRGPVRRRPRT